MINQQTSKPSLLTSLKLKGKFNTDPKAITDRFCKYFNNIGPSLAGVIPAVNSNFRSFLIHNNNNPITLKPTTTIEYENISKTLASGEVPGYDRIPMHLIKSCFH